MIEAKDVRANPERMRKAIAQRGVNPEKANLDRWLELDEEKRRLQAAIDTGNAEKKRLASLGRTDPAAARARGQELREQGRELEERLAAVNQEWQAILDWFPNWPHPQMPVGAGEADNVEECAWVPGWGYLATESLGRGATSAALMPKRPVHAPDRDFRPVHYADLGEKLGIDTTQGAKVAGSRFAYILGDLARLQWAAQQLLVGRLLADGYQPIIPPLLVRERSLYGTSHFPEGRDQVYEIKTDNVENPNPLFLVGSSEPANFSYFMDRVLPEAALPIKVFASTPCFRSEAGSWGKDVRGIKRVHQFDKLELNAVCRPDQSEALYEEFRGINEWFLQTLAIPYRIVDKCGRDAGYLAAHRQRDVEAWLSGLGEFLEVMTDTNTTDYQARRLNIRYRPADGPLRFCHTVNDTGCAFGRLLIAILDNYQQPDGSVLVPAALQAAMGKATLTPLNEKG